MAKDLNNKLKISPLGDRVLVTVSPREEKTASGIIIPDTVSDEQKDNKEGKVVAVGPGKYDDGVLVPMQVKKGDKVLFQWGDKIEIDDVEYYMVSESSILAIVG